MGGRSTLRSVSVTGVAAQKSPNPYRESEMRTSEPKPH